jgi:uncharacterized protein (DUF849 family)
LRKTIITCAVTGNITTRAQHSELPVLPLEIAEAALLAAKAGAAVVHIHVRDPETGKGSMELALYAEVVERIRAVDRSLVINLTTGQGGRFVPGEDEPKVAGPGTTLTHPEKRVAHISALKPDICSLDLNTMNSGADVVINTPKSVTRMATVIKQAGVKPELEIFDSGDLRLALDLMQAGVLDAPGLFSFVLGVNYGFGATPETLMFAKSMLPPQAIWTGFGIARHSFPMVAQSFLLGGHVRVGLEDNVYLEKGVLAPSNAALVMKARRIVEDLGGAIATSEDARAILGLND